MKYSKIKQVRAWVVKGGGGADYHDQGEGHWIDNHIATAMGRYPEYRQSRKSFGINVLGTLVVEIEAENGTIGFAVTTGGEPAAYMVEKHFARFLEGRDPADYETIWDQMYFASQYYGRKGIVVNAISGVRSRLVGLARASARRAGCTTCWAGRCATNCSSMPPARGPTWRRRWASSAASCPCCTVPSKATKA